MDPPGFSVDFDDDPTSVETCTRLSVNICDSLILKCERIKTVGRSFFSPNNTQRAARVVPHCELKLHVLDRRHNPYQQHLHTCAETLHLSVGGRWSTNHYSGLKCAVEISAKMGVNSAHSSCNDTTLTPFGRLYSGCRVSCRIPKWDVFCRHTSYLSPPPPPAVVYFSQAGVPF